MIWSIWKARNNTIFRGFKSEVQEVVVGVICLLKDYPELPRVSRCRRIGDGPDIHVAISNNLYSVFQWHIQPGIFCLVPLRRL